MSTTRSPQELTALVRRAREFIDDVVIPREDLSQAKNRDYQLRIGKELRALASAQGLTSPRSALAEGGLGRSWEVPVGWRWANGTDGPSLPCGPMPGIVSDERGSLP